MTSYSGFINDKERWENNIVSNKGCNKIYFLQYTYVCILYFNFRYAAKDLPADENSLRSWLNKKWLEKEQNLKSFIHNGKQSIYAYNLNMYEKILFWSDLKTKSKYTLQDKF